jgi:peroxiredoxin
MRDDLTPGARFPDFVLPDHTKTPRRLSDLQGDQLMIVFLTRGFFCPKDRAHMHELVRFHPQLVVGYTQVVTITTDDWHITNNYRQQTAAPWPFVYDEERMVQKDLDIYKIYNGYYYWGRPSMAELHADLRTLAKQTYPDWDITRPELREKWERGEKSDFYPYSKEGISMETLMLQMAGAVDQYAGEAGED